MKSLAESAMWQRWNREKLARMSGDGFQGQWGGAMGGWVEPVGPLLPPPPPPRLGQRMKWSNIYLATRR